MLLIHDVSRSTVRQQTANSRGPGGSTFRQPHQSTEEGVDCQWIILVRLHSRRWPDKGGETTSLWPWLQDTGYLQASRGCPQDAGQTDTPNYA